MNELRYQRRTLLAAKRLQPHANAFQKGTRCCRIEQKFSQDTQDARRNASAGRISELETDGTGCDCRGTHTPVQMRERGHNNASHAIPIFARIPAHAGMQFDHDAPMESFFYSLKIERVFHENYETRAEAKQDVRIIRKALRYRTRKCESMYGTMNRFALSNLH